MAIDLNEEVRIFGFTRPDLILFICGEFLLLLLGIMASLMFGVIPGVSLWVVCVICFSCFMFWNNTLPKNYLLLKLKSLYKPRHYVPFNRVRPSLLEKELHEIENSN